MFFSWNVTSPNMNDTNWTSVEGSSYDQFKVDKIILLCIYIPVFVVALVGNILVLVMVCMNKSVRRSVSNYFLVNLAVADLLVTLVCIPLTVTQMIYPVWVYGDFMCRTLDFMQGVSVEGSVLTIVCMSTERYFAIRLPMKVRTICNELNVKIAILITWILAIIIMCPLVLYKKLIVIQSHTLLFNESQFLFNFTEEVPSISREACVEAWPSTSGKIAYDVFLLFIIYVIPGFIVVVLYSLIGCSLCKKNHDLNRANSVISNDVKVMASRRKLARMMIIISILFALCWLPYFIIIICTDFVKFRETLDTLYPFALLLAHSHSAQNPILYCFMHRGFYDFLSKIARCQFSSINKRQMKNSFTSSGKRTQSLRVSNMANGTEDERKRLVVTLSDPGTADERKRLVVTMAAPGKPGKPV